jgi:hypothetical protein
MITEKIIAKGRTARIALWRLVGLSSSWLSRKPSTWVFLLHLAKNIFSDSFHIRGRKRAGRRGLQEPINNSLKDSNPELRIDGGIEQINVTDFNAHKSSLLLNGGWEISGVPRFLVFFKEP